ncbi:MAG TPA: CoA transferase [Dehalococcoidia bacterium]|nr:CoA transferase [Dehalococcoidia bacterium]
MTLPLEGVRVADFSWVVAGPFTTQALALMGAEVIRIESSVHTDINRRLPPAAEGELGIERSGLWHGLNLNKKSVTLNLATAEAQALAREIVARCDIAVENFSFGQLEKFNLGFDRLREVNPEVIFVTSSGLGRTGPYREYVTFGPPLTAYTGLASLTGQDGGQPERWVGGLWCDHQAGMTSLFGLLAALEHRDRTGEGQMVEYSMAEAIAGQLPEALIEFGVTGDVPGPRGNVDPGMCPHGIYRAAGNDRWVAIAVQNDFDWERFLEVLGGPAWLEDSQFATVEGRLRQRGEIDRAVEAWTRLQSPEDSASLLQNAAISAGPVAKVEDLLANPHLRAAGFFYTQEHPEVGARELAGLGWNMAATQNLPIKHAPLLGENNWEVFVDWLGLPAERFAEHVASGIIV